MKLIINLIFLSTILVFSSGYTILSLGLSMGKMAMPGPGLIPLVAGIMAAVLSAILLLKDLKVFLIQKKSDSVPEAEVVVEHPWRILWFVLTFGIYVLLFQPLGYLISTSLFATVLFRIMENRWMTCILAGVASAIAFYLLFSLLAVPLPMGILSGFNLF